MNLDLVDQEKARVSQQFHELPHDISYCTATSPIVRQFASHDSPPRGSLIRFSFNSRTSEANQPAWRAPFPTAGPRAGRTESKRWPIDSSSRAPQKKIAKPAADEVNCRSRPTKVYDDSDSATDCHTLVASFPPSVSCVRGGLLYLVSFSLIPSDSIRSHVAPDSSSYVDFASWWTVASLSRIGHIYPRYRPLYPHACTSLRRRPSPTSSADSPSLFTQYTHTRGPFLNSRIYLLSFLCSSVNTVYDSFFFYN